MREYLCAKMLLSKNDLLAYSTKSLRFGALFSISVREARRLKAWLSRDFRLGDGGDEGAGRKLNMSSMEGGSSIWEMGRDLSWRSDDGLEGDRAGDADILAAAESISESPLMTTK